jgi:hypothetical protein
MTITPRLLALGALTGLALLTGCAGAPDSTSLAVYKANDTGSICSQKAQPVLRFDGVVEKRWDCGSDSMLAMSSLTYTQYFTY